MTTCTERTLARALAGLLVAGAAGAAEPDAAVLDPIVVVGTRQPGAAWDVAASVSVLTAQDADDLLAADFRDLLHDQPGVAFDGGGTRFPGEGFRIRGLGGNRVLTLVDGIPVAERFAVGSYGDSGRDYAELGLLRQLEILRGPASSLYGSKALGGVVAIETLEPDDLLGGARATARYAGDRNELGAAAAGAWGAPDAALLLAAVHRDGHELEAAGATLRDPQDRRRDSVLAKSALDTRLGTLHLVLDYGDEQRETDIRSLLGTGRFASTTSLAATDAQDTWRAGAQLEQAGTGEARRLWRAWATRSALTEDSDEYRELANPPVRQQRRFEFSQRAAGLGLDARQSLAWHGARAFGYGFEAAWGRLQEGRDALQTNLADGTQSTVLLGETFPRRDFPITDTLEGGAYAHGELAVPGSALIVMPGLRYDYARLEAKPDARFVAGSPDVAVTDLTSDAWTPRLGVLYPLTPRLRGYAQYTRGFRAPPAYDVNLGIDIVTVNARALPNPDLRAEHSDALELGLRWRGDTARAECDVFETRYRDFILSNSFIGVEAATGARLYQSVNVERARIRGVELRLRQALDDLGAPQWSVELAGAWLHGENRDSDQPLNSIDPPRGVAGIAREAGATALRVRLSAAAAQSRVDDSAGARFRTPGYAAVDLLGEWRPRPSLTLRAGVFNALDRRYWEWSDVYNRPATDPQLPLLARAGRNGGISAQLRF